jgi:hypothetical protein
MGASAKVTNGQVVSRGPSSKALLIMGYRSEFTRGVLKASCSLIALGILALIVSFGVSILF